MNGEMTTSYKLLRALERVTLEEMWTSNFEHTFSDKEEPRMDRYYMDASCSQYIFILTQI